ncbi:alpha/beta fold hydrolase [Stakelama saccharophila]|uniref:Alpha/beta hydrolase n=1 Tax=Stakelama saccharophila TaxID=3075605 RepID=A0ABZ0BAM9_9SPHN|nr:alpha/beta hydrolase [Stakelama sp. W311]WNO54330.1 alpha/beta hydrolase [Stakelama sp. W311]
MEPWPRSVDIDATKGAEAMPIAFLLALAAAQAGTMPDAPPLGANLERFDYRAPVHWFETQAQGGTVQMAYLDFTPTGPSRDRTLVLLHGKNFCSATWIETARALAARGYRVIAPDQVGFCKSSKPAGFQYSFAALATLTDALLADVGAGPVTVVGHSTGGMLAMHYGLLYPERVAQLVLVDPLGLNDTLAEGVPYAPLDVLRAEEAKKDAAAIKAYQRRVYYHGRWRPAYDRWVRMLAGQYASADGDRVRDAQARLSDMIETQPVAARLGAIEAPTTLIAGSLDTTAFRASSAPKNKREAIRTVPEAARDVAARLPGWKLVELDGLGHSPMVEAPDRFQRVLLRVLDSS